MRTIATLNRIRWAKCWAAAAVLGIGLLSSGTAAADDGPAAPAPATGQKKNGVTVGADFTMSLLNMVQGNVVSLFAIQGGVFGGYKIDRFIVGLAVDISRVSQDQTQTNTVNNNSTTTSSSQTNTNLLIMPGVRATLLRSSDQRADLFGSLDLGWGHVFLDRSMTPPNPNPGTSTSDNNIFIYQLGLGIRYWMHPSFAFYALPMLRGTFQFTSSSSSSSNGNFSTSSTSSGVLAVTTVDANIGFLGVF